MFLSLLHHLWRTCFRLYSLQKHKQAIKTTLLATILIIQVKLTLKLADLQPSVPLQDTDVAESVTSSYENSEQGVTSNKSFYKVMPNILKVAPRLF